MNKTDLSTVRTMWLTAVGVILGGAYMGSASSAELVSCRSAIGRALVETVDSAHEKLVAAELRPQARLLTPEDIEAHIGDPRRIRWAKAASLLIDVVESCVDGRDSHPVVGTPGGDAGELLLTLATAEHMIGQPLPEAEMEALFDAHLGAFGSFYMHSDAHALRAVADALQADPVFAGVLDELQHPATVEAFVRHPPPELREPLLDHLVVPHSIGCGHLKLIFEHPDEYGVRKGLAAAMLAMFYRRLWEDSPRLQLVFLDGGHTEGAVVNVKLDGPVHAYTDVPMIEPNHAGTEIFVNHPQVAQWLRRQNAEFMTEREAWLHAHHVAPEAFLAELEALARKQLVRSIEHLGKGLPVYDVSFSEGGAEVRPWSPGSKLAGVSVTSPRPG